LGAGGVVAIAGLPGGRLPAGPGLVPYILAGPWYLTWLTSSVLLILMFIYGMWFGIVYRR
jgi:hypothetical protein